jgi:uncharacterized protein YjeT (DUF2065 family)
MNTFLQILGFILMICGVVITYAARFIVEKYNLIQNVNVQFKNELTEKEEADYRLNSALLKIKIIGALVCLPGVLILFLIFRK